MQRNYLCVFEIETLADDVSLASAVHMPGFQRQIAGNYVTIPLNNATALGMHMEDAEDAPLSPTNNTALRTYLDNIRLYYVKEMEVIVHEYLTKITTNFGV